MPDQIKSVLTVSGTQAGQDRLEQSIAICQSMGAQLTVMVMDLARPSPVSQYGTADAIHRGESYEHGLKAIETRAQQVEQLVADSGVRAQVVTAYAMPSEVDNIVADYAMFTDLTVLPLRLPVELPMFRHAFYGVLFRAGSPVLLLPEGADITFPSPNHTMIAWDSGLQSARAIRHSLSGLIQAKMVTSVTVDGAPGHGGLDERMIRYLNSHDVNTSVRSMSKEGGSTGQTLVKAANDLQADLIVMGAYGHSRLREFIVGGTTRYLVEHAKTPVFMVH